MKTFCLLLCFLLGLFSVAAKPPAFVQVLYDGQYECDAMAISPQYFLTTGFCPKRNGETVVDKYEIVLSSKETGKKPLHYKVEQIISYPQKFKNDEELNVRGDEIIKLATSINEISIPDVKVNKPLADWIKSTVGITVKYYKITENED